MKLTRFIVTLVVTLMFVILSGNIPVHAADENRLYLSETDNKLYYRTTLNSDNRFMNHLSMTPGDVYHDELLIENGCSLGYDLYFKVIPIKQSFDSDNLLENIRMKVYMDGRLKYDGKVTGKDYGNGLNLRHVIPIGHYEPGRTSKLTVDLHFSPGYKVTKEVFARIDWQFWGTGKDKEFPQQIQPETPSDAAQPQPSGLPGTLGNPKTGDDNSLFVILIVAMTLIAAVLIILIGSRRKKSGMGNL